MATEVEDDDAVQDDERPGVRTRRSNRDAHPGRKAMEILNEGAPTMAKRRTSEQVRDEKAAKAKAKAAAEAEEEEHIRKIARLENQIEKDDEQAASASSSAKRPRPPRAGGNARGAGRPSRTAVGGRGRGAPGSAAKDVIDKSKQPGDTSSGVGRGRGRGQDSGVDRGHTKDNTAPVQVGDGDDGNGPLPVENDDDEMDPLSDGDDTRRVGRVEENGADFEDDNMSVDLPGLATDNEPTRSSGNQARPNVQPGKSMPVTSVNPDEIQKAQKGKISIRKRVQEARKAKEVEASSHDLPSSGSEKISSWRNGVEPGGDHVSDVSAPTSKVGKTFSLHPKDSASCAASPESSVLSAVTGSRKGSQVEIPPPSTASTTLSVNILPPSPQKKNSALTDGNVSVQKRSATESLKVSDAGDSKRCRSRSRSASASESRDGRSKFTNKDLPFNLGSEKIWRSVFCVTLFEYMGLQDDPWSLSVEFIEDIWGIVLKHLEHEIKSNGAVYYVVSQRLCEWRGKFARGALSVLEKHFDSESFKAENDKRSPEKVAEYARHMLEETEVGYRFVYADTENQKSCFRHPFIAETLAIHLQSIEGSIGLEEVFKDEPECLHPKGALILTCVAVLRALKLYKTGTCASHIGDFSGDQVEADRAYFAEFIDMKPTIWAKVIQEARKFVPSGSRRSTSRSRPIVTAPVKRAVLREDSDED